MKKEIFNKALCNKLTILPEQEKNRIIGFYNEYIDDRMENGEYEENIISSLGPIERIAEKIIQDFHEEKIVTPIDIDERVKKEKKLNFDDISEEAKTDYNPNMRYKENSKTDYNPNMQFKNEVKKNNDEKFSSVRNVEISQTARSKEKGKSSALKILLIIVGCFIVFPFVFGLGFGIFGIVIGLLAVLVSFYIASLAIVLSSFVIFFGSFTILSVNMNSALLQMASGVLCLGAGIVTMYLVVAFTKLVLKSIKKIGKKVVGKNA